MLKSRNYRLPSQFAGDATLLNGVIHDLRQPMALLSAVLAHEDEDNPGRLALCELQYLVEELCDLKHGSVTQTDAPCTIFRLDDLFRAAAIASRPLTTRAPFQVEFASSDLTLRAPRSWIYRILSNLISNAIKHSGGSRVEALAEMGPQGLRLIVRDDGRGMPRDLLDLVYQRRHEHDTQRQGVSSLANAGRGLRTAMLLVDAMRGKMLAVTSKQGTEWRIELDVEIISAPLLSLRAGEHPLKGTVVAVLDDQRVQAEAVGQRFADLGAEVLIFTDDFDLLTFTQDKTVDLYILDYMLADCFANRAVAQLAQRPGPPTIVILTAHPNHPALMHIIPRVPIMTKPISEHHFQSLATSLADGWLARTNSCAKTQLRLFSAVARISLRAQSGSTSLDSI